MFPFDLAVPLSATQTESVLRHGSAQRCRGPGDATPTRTSQGHVSPRGGLLATRSVLDLQAAVGNRAVARMLGLATTLSERSVAEPAPSVQRQAPEATPTIVPPVSHRTLRIWMRGPEVADLQDRLNRAGADPPLALDGIFGGKTYGAVRRYQHVHELKVDGVVGRETWTSLDGESTATGGGSTTTARKDGADGDDTPGGGGTSGGGPEEDVRGQPQAPAIGSTHPILSPGSRGAAVEEAQHRLNNYFFDNAVERVPLPTHGYFDAETVLAVVAFRARENVSDPTVGPQQVGPGTWRRMDQVATRTPVGRVEKKWQQTTSEGTFPPYVSRYAYRVTAGEVRVEVLIRFTGDTDLVSVALDAIRRQWNRFAAVRTDDTEQIPNRLNINFYPSAEAGSPDNSARLERIPPGEYERPNVNTWRMNEEVADYVAPHEFGHMIGLEDEYSRSHGDIARLTGGGPSSTSTVEPYDAAIATEIHHVLFSDPGLLGLLDVIPIIGIFGPGVPAKRAAALEGIIKTNGLEYNERGRYEVARAYGKYFGPGGLFASDSLDIWSAIKAQLHPEHQKRYIDLFAFESETLMGETSTHSHRQVIEPRQVRQFALFAQQYIGGEWHARAR